MGTVGLAVLGVIAEVVDLQEVSPDQRVEDLHTNSVTLLRLIDGLRERFDISMDAFTAERAGDLVAPVEARIAPQPRLIRRGSAAGWRLAWCRWT